MGNTDSIPVVSQVKTGVQLICGDTDGAARTAENFLRECPGVSQVTSLVQLVAGDGEGALETQKRCGKGLLKAADGIPVVGHAKGIIHYIAGDEEGGDQAMKAATRTTGVMAGGAVGFLTLGPVGAVVGGIEGGAVMDVGTTVVTGKPAGYVAAIKNAVENPNPGDIFDLTVMPVSDGLAGYGAGKMVQKYQASGNSQPGGSGNGNVKSQQQVGLDNFKADHLERQAMSELNAAELKIDANKAGTAHYPEQTIIEQSNKAKSLYNEAQNLRGKQTPSVNLKAQGAQSSTGIKTSTTATVVTPRQDQSQAQAQEPQASSSNSASKQEHYFQLNLEQLITHTMEFFEKNSIKFFVTNKMAAVKPLLKYLLTDELSAILENIRSLNLKIKYFCWYETHWYLITVYWSKFGCVPLAVKVTKEVYEKARNKAKKMTREEIRTILTPIFEEDLAKNDGEEEKKDPKRGHHVINNHVLKIYGKIIKKFLQGQGKGNLQEFSEPLGLPFTKERMLRIGGRCHKAHFQPIGPPVDHHIQDVMKVHIEGIHLDLNSVWYGLITKWLIHTIVKMMTNAPDWQDQNKRDARFIVGCMTNGELFVDHGALRKWLDNGGQRSMYDNAFKEVTGMLERLCHGSACQPLLWVGELQSGYTI